MPLALAGMHQSGHQRRYRANHRIVSSSCRHAKIPCNLEEITRLVYSCTPFPPSLAVISLSYLENGVARDKVTNSPRRDEAGNATLAQNSRDDNFSKRGGGTSRGKLLRQFSSEMLWILIGWSKRADLLFATQPTTSFYSIRYLIVSILRPRTIPSSRLLRNYGSIYLFE